MNGHTRMNRSKVLDRIEGTRSLISRLSYILRAIGLPKNNRESVAPGSLGPPFEAQGFPCASFLDLIYVVSGKRVN